MQGPWLRLLQRVIDVSLGDIDVVADMDRGDEPAQIAEPVVRET